MITSTIKQKNKKKGLTPAIIAIMGFGLILTTFGIFSFIKSTQLGGEFMENLMGYQNQKCVESYTNPKYTEDKNDMYDKAITRETAKMLCEMEAKKTDGWLRCSFDWNQVKDKMVGNTLYTGLTCMAISGDSNNVICTGAASAFLAAGDIFSTAINTKCTTTEDTYAGIRGSDGYKRAILVKIIAEEGVETVGILTLGSAIKGAIDITEATQASRNLATMSADDIATKVTRLNYKQYVTATAYQLNGIRNEIKALTLKIAQQEALVGKMLYEGSYSATQLTDAKLLLSSHRTEYKRLLQINSEYWKQFERLSKILPTGNIGSVRKVATNTLRTLENTQNLKTAYQAIDLAASTTNFIDSVKKAGPATNFLRFGIPALGALSSGVVIAAVANPGLLPDHLETALSSVNPFESKLRLFDYAYDMVHIIRSGD
ncbi:MAG: hypothetical protein K0B02_04930 [DPANN group archaeon]|nr:hypothetical protein [DPANN group archaeon]